MKVSIEHVEKTKGMMFKKTFYGVKLTVEFSEEEAQIIRDRKLKDVAIMERDVPVDVDADKFESRGLAKKAYTAATKGTHGNHFHLTIGRLLAGPDVYHFATPIEAKEYEQELREVLPNLKAYVMENEGIEQKTDSFEL